jgi:Fe-S-cluster containining protein
MNIPLFIIYMVLLLALFIFIQKGALQNLLIRNRKFSCINCGCCCRLRVELSDDEIRKIRKHVKIEFAEKEKNKNYIKRINKYCIFLKILEGKSRCMIYPYRPKICRNFPKTTVLGIRANDTRCRSFSQP